MSLPVASCETAASLRPHRFAAENMSKVRAERLAKCIAGSSLRFYNENTMI
jgi:hypothetical protein